MMQNPDGQYRQNSDGQFNRKAFSWNLPNRPSPAEKAAKGPVKGTDCADRIFEVIVPTTVVRAEPHVNAKLKSKKSRGGRVFCSGVSMNGWLKLASEPGWLISHMRGMEGIDEVATLVDGPSNGSDSSVKLAVGEYQPQGMCCFEVVFNLGVPSRESPSRTANALGIHKAGEYVFANLQNFDGWVKLAGEEGWMLSFSADMGELLKPRKNTSHLDLWALSDAWAAARKRPNRNSGLDAKDVEDLKELEKKLVTDANSLFEQYVKTGKQDKLIEEGFITKQDMSESLGAYVSSELWVRQRLFAGVLARRIREGEAGLLELLPDLSLSPRQPPLPEETFKDEEEEYGSWDQAEADLSAQAFEGTTPFEYDGREFVIAPNFVIFEPPNQVPIGIWNAETKKIDPAAGMVPGCPYAAISYYGKTYLLMPDDKLLDPDTQAVVGTYKADTNELQLDAEDGAIYDPVFDDGEPVDVSEYLERGHQMAKKGRFKAAACLYGEALKGCAQTRAVDMEFECEIFRARANCWKELGNHKELLLDAERILSFNNADADAKAWKKIAQDAQAMELESTKEAPKKTEKCIHCNGVAQKCLKCGAGMEKCAHCSKPVSRANCCSKCHCTYYCNRDCQRIHWKVHKLECQSCTE